MLLATMLIWSVCAVLLWAAFLTTPRWFVRSLHRHRVWRFRDEVVSKMLDGVLPNHPATIELVVDAERTIDYCDKINLVTLLVTYRTTSRMSDGGRKHMDKAIERCSLDGLSDDHREAVIAARRRLATLRTGMVILGSWIGIAFVVSRLPSSVRAVRTARRSLSVATDEAATQTRIGQAVYDVVNDGWRGGGFGTAIAV